MAVSTDRNSFKGAVGSFRGVQGFPFLEWLPFLVMQGRFSVQLGGSWDFVTT